MATRADKRQTDRNGELLRDVLSRSESILRSQARRHASRPDDVEDILQFAYLQFLERFNDRYEPLPWLQTTIKRRAWGLARLSNRRHELPITLPLCSRAQGYDLAEVIPDQGPGPSELAGERDETQRIGAEFKGLKPDERTALGLLALGYSYREIGELHGWTQTKVNRCLTEGRATLRARVAGERSAAT